MAHRRMRTVTNYFLVNLSVADLLMALLNCAFNFAFMLNSDWPFGGVYCSASNFVANVTVASSAFTLAAISLDSSMATVDPTQQLKHHMAHRQPVVVYYVPSSQMYGGCCRMTQRPLCDVSCAPKIYGDYIRCSTYDVTAACE
ncbi:tachykinin-like peptides receptor 86C [Schistocerca piceifrons]|uniref:tachykinin-like peptides receptor 86C n=1 Tax=Schistocerca piceifrons TaxID=274613 RepID=UPI001F5E4F39|nr:tachykinin-like peptides receptor 86C [Schistocerca piceifrons]